MESNMSIYQDTTKSPSLKLIAFVLTIFACGAFAAAMAYNQTLTTSAPADVSEKAPGTGV